MDAPEIPHGGGEHGAGKITDALKHKYHGVPGYAIAGIAIVGIVVVAKLRGGSSAAATPTVTNPDGSLLVPNGTGLDGGSGGGASGDPTFGDGMLPGTIVTGSDGGVDTTPSTPQDGGIAVPLTVPIAPPDSNSSPIPTRVMQTLDVSSGGALVGQVQAPVFSIGTPASVLYNAVGLQASDPYTLTPPSSPMTAAQSAEQADGQAIRQAQATAAATHKAVAV